LYPNFQIAPGTASHAKIRLTGQGIKKINSGQKGDHYVHIKIAIPKDLTTEQRALVQAYAELEADTPGFVYGITRKNDGKLPLTLNIF